MKGFVRFGRVQGGVLAAVALVCAWAPGVAQAQDTLEGEVISAYVQEFADLGSLTLSCDPGTNSGSATFSAEARPGEAAAGAATGPYPVTAVESGSLEFTGGVITRFDVSFEIFSGDNTISGTKALAPGVVGRASCVALSPAESGIVLTFSAPLRYEATINGVTTTGDAAFSGQCGSTPSNDSCALQEGFGPADGVQQCADGSDNDEDSRTDFPADPGCETALDESESPDPDPTPKPACSDGIDNDGDGVSDGADPGCESADDPSEVDPVVGRRARTSARRTASRTIPRWDSRTRASACRTS